LRKAGIVTLAPDLFHGDHPTTKEQAAKLMGALDRKKAIAEIGDSVAWLKGNARCMWQGGGDWLLHGRFSRHSRRRAQFELEVC
jgi:dienelactone hydrolase